MSDTKELPANNNVKLADVPDFHRRTDIRLALPIDLYDEIHERFPDSSHKRTQDANERLRFLLADTMYRAMHDKGAAFSTHTHLLTDMWGQRARKKVVNAFNEMSCFALLQCHYAGVSCKLRAFHHPEMVSTYTSPGPGGPDRCYMARHVFGGKTGCFTIPCDWLNENGRRFRSSSSAMWMMSHDYLIHLRSSVDSLIVMHVDYADCLDAASRSRNSSGRSTVDEKASHYLRQWQMFVRDPLAYCFRSSGRVYNPLCNQPKALRRQFLRYDFEGESVATTEVDLSSSYFAFLATMLPPGDDVDLLKRDLEDGQFYERLAECCDSQLFKDRKALKIAAQVHCLFGNDRFGRQPLFGAMRSRYPSLARFVADIRLSKGVVKQSSARHLARMLMKAEGAFFIDQLLPQLLLVGVPTMTIHDGVIVPEPVAEKVRELASTLFENTFGFRASFSIKK